MPFCRAPPANFGQRLPWGSDFWKNLNFWAKRFRKISKLWRRTRQNFLKIGRFFEKKMIFLRNIFKSKSLIIFFDTIKTPNLIKFR